MKNKIKKIIGFITIGVLCIFLGVFVSACSNSDTQQSAIQEKNLQQANDAVGMPSISNFFEKKLAKRVLELRDDSKLINYVYTQNINVA